ncbi:hypothetical protein [Streptomyces albidoflavus]|uniref:hypothetical protein n=1 Tax=Streptomyces albidoflavus TaxID=1886 RepID=UPI0033260998
MSEQTPEQRQAYIDALLVERTAYERYGKQERAAAVDAELDRLGVTRQDVHPDVEAAVSAPQETAVPARRGRPRKA